MPSIVDGRILPPFRFDAGASVNTEAILLLSKRTCDLKLKQFPLVGSMIINKTELHATDQGSATTFFGRNFRED